MEETDKAKARRTKIILMLVVLTPVISLAFFFIYFWLHGITIVR